MVLTTITNGKNKLLMVLTTITNGKNKLLMVLSTITNGKNHAEASEVWAVGSLRAFTLLM